MRNTFLLNIECKTHIFKTWIFLPLTCIKFSKITLHLPSHLLILVYFLGVIGMDLPTLRHHSYSFSKVVTMVNEQIILILKKACIYIYVVFQYIILVCTNLALLVNIICCYFTYLCTVSPQGTYKFIVICAQNRVFS